MDVKDPVEVARNEAMERVKELPSNRGYLVVVSHTVVERRGVDTMVKGMRLTMMITFKLIDVINKRVHIWTRKGYIVKKIDGQNVWGCLEH